MTSDARIAAFSLVAGLIAVIGLVFFNKTPTKTTGVRYVLVAASDLPAGKELMEQDFVNKGIPTDTEFDTEFFNSAKPEDKSLFIRAKDGKPLRLKRPLRQGAPFYPSEHLSEVLDLTIAKGKFAMQIPGGGTATMANLLVPNQSRVRILVTRPVQEISKDPKPAPTAPAVQASAEEMLRQALMGQTSQNPRPKYETVEVLKQEDAKEGVSLKVLAVGRLLYRTNQQFPGEAPSDSLGSGADITVEVDMTQAMTLLRETGRFSHPITLLLEPDPGR